MEPYDRVAHQKILGCVRPAIFINTLVVIEAHHLLSLARRLEPTARAVHFIAPFILNILRHFAKVIKELHEGVPHAARKVCECRA